MISKHLTYRHAKHVQRSAQAASTPCGDPHLRQATRLEHGRNHDEITARVDEVAQRLVVRETEGRVLTAQLVTQGIELALDFGIGSRAQQHELTAPLQRPVRRMLDQVNSCSSNKAPCHNESTRHDISEVHYF